MFVQILTNGIIAASGYLLVALGFSLIYSTARFFNFAHGVIFTSAPYFAYAFHKAGLAPLGVSIVAAVGLSTILGCILEIGCYRPLRRRAASPLVLLLASLGLYIVMQNLISMAFGDDTKSITSITGNQGLAVLGARITPIQILSVLLACILTMGLAALMRGPFIGKAIRAVATDSELAIIRGLKVDQIILVTFAIGSALAGVAGVLVALDVNMRPAMGMHALLMAVVVTIVGGIGSVPGTALAALIVGLSQHFAAWSIGAHWQDAVVFVILILFLLLRPQGIFGKPLRRATI